MTELDGHPAQTLADTHTADPARRAHCAPVSPCCVPRSRSKGTPHSVPGRLARAALELAAIGWPVFPVRPRAKNPAISNWEKDASTDPDRITAWWSARPFNIGIPTGRAGLLVIDLDPAHGHPPPPQWAGACSGADVLARLATAAGEAMPTDTYTVSTPSGGQHLYFRQPDDVALRNTQRGLGWRIDTRGHGGYVIAAGSVTPQGRYRAVRAPVADLPAWLVSALTPPPRVTAVALPPPSIQVHRVRAYVRAVVDGEQRAVAAAAVGHRHHVLLGAARRLGHWVGGGVLSEAYVRRLLTDAAAGYVGVEGYTARQIERDITDGLSYGARLPRDSPPDRWSPATTHRCSGSLTPDDRRAGSRGPLPTRPMGPAGLSTPAMG